MIYNYGRTESWSSFKWSLAVWLVAAVCRSFEATWYDTSRSSKQSSRQENIRAIASLYLNKSHPVLIITVWLNCRNWWHKTQCPIFMCFLLTFDFETSLHALFMLLKNWVSKYRYGCSSGGGGMLRASSLVCFPGINANRHSWDKRGTSSAEHFAPSSIFKSTVHEWTPPNVLSEISPACSWTRMVWF